MKLDRLAVFKALNIAVIAAAVVVCVIIASEAYKCADKDIFYIAPVINNNAYYFSTDELEEITAVCSPVKLASKASGSGLISFGNLRAYSKIIYTNSDYFQLNNIQFIHGGAWSADRENAIIVNESLAWQLFGSVDAIGKEVIVSNESYNIIGIVKQEKISPNDCLAYMPMNPAFGERVINDIYVKTSNYNKLGLYNDLNSFFEKAGKDKRDYYITDINRYIENIGLKYKLLFLAVGIYAAMIIIVNSYKLLKLNRLSQKNAIKFAGLFALDLLFIIILTKSVSLDIWLPHGENGRVVELIRTVTNGGFLPSAEYLTDGLSRLVKLNSYANTALIFGCVALFNFVFVHRGDKQS